MIEMDGKLQINIYCYNSNCNSKRNVLMVSDNANNDNCNVKNAVDTYK